MANPRSALALLAAVAACLVAAASARQGIFQPPPMEGPQPGDRRPFDPVWPSAIDPAGTPSGTCAPFKPPAPHQYLLDYCKEMRSKPVSYFNDLYYKPANIPKKGDAFPLSGCVFGCLVSGNDPHYVAIQEAFGRTFGWSGKCFSEERVDGVPKRFGSTLQRDYYAESGKNQSQRASTFKGVGDFVFGGDGSFTEKGLADGKPAWQYKDDRATPEMMFAGGWRTLYNMFQGVGDGVTDEFRSVGPGIMLGKSFYAGPQGLLPEFLRVPRDTNYFMLFQGCTADGLIPWKPENRDLPIVGRS
ncbi:MAG: hypothetical protein J3K34DRAFT_519024 [Monoraphidium minutum]|nr:MAG: hypothetical protein J3K34DRAFT_519024 [Monoraphidium minutum]